ncbi:hypothetical protein TBLA_0A01760 [Henningerozyma blattae CBS 6284]|uniref:Oligopeptide transporter n=1 Tax=Henningerozyma blattae (strain ATCC 34711 / CBS 6284 / DSM 70876 / NBRC 10599 / NRRL Y-10934 / UCD 77-7) TaxID=1071380 RepID=I2GV24_HENB6|nr:hypothetical protein TBLA_0A01760 [Tetrapisispora blattae CBS 6284]CCH57976.1 hypothetical protein TBLA_0A01760 [Tetrapisispora blattae CBS 6284]
MEKLRKKMKKKRKEKRNVNTDDELPGAPISHKHVIEYGSTHVTSASPLHVTSLTCTHVTSLACTHVTPLRLVTCSVTGLAIGTLLLIANFQFGLQTGWVSMMSLPAALLACTALPQVTPAEAVFAQSVAVAVGTGPLAFGFVGVIPAVEKLLRPDETGGVRLAGQLFTLPELVTWAAALAFFGVFCAVPLRKHAIITEKLRFPSGSATATLIGVLTGTTAGRGANAGADAISGAELSGAELSGAEISGASPRDTNPAATNTITNTITSTLANTNTSPPISLLKNTFIFSSIFSAITYIFPILQNIPFLGSHLAHNYLWTFQLSPAYFGQGAIMGLPTVSHMLGGCVLGWAILAPLARHNEWVSPDSPPNDWENGIQGWILWTALSIMIADAVVGFVVFIVRSMIKLIHSNTKEFTMELSQLDGNDSLSDVPPNELVTSTTVISGLIISSLLCIILMLRLFGSQLVPIYSILLSLCLAFFFAVLAIRALGETDLNPVSGIGKLSQLIFAIVIPRSHKGAVLLNLVAGAIAEAGAQQAGDLMQDLKTGHLVGAAPRDQFIAQLLGTLWSVPLSAIVYYCYSHIYTIPGDRFRVPTAAVWVDCARLVLGQNLPKHALDCALVFAIIASFLSLIKNCYPNRTRWVPSGIAMGVGICNTPNFTLARFLGGMISSIWNHYNVSLDSTLMIIFCSGLILGEGCFSIVSMALTYFT